MATRVTGNKSTVLYLYGISEGEPSAVEKLSGVDGRSAVEPLPSSGMVCWVSRVSATEFADNLASNMENLDWLADASVNHQRVVAALAQASEILPARFGTVFRSESSLEADVRSRKRVLQADFAKVRGSDEWGVKVFGVAPKLELPKSESPRTGKDYLKAKAALLSKRPEKGKVSPAEFSALSQELQKLAVETAEVGKVSGGQRGLQWQTALLLKRGDQKKFGAVLRKFSKLWAGTRQIECTGPWPPYSFVSKSES